MGRLKDAVTKARTEPVPNAFMASAANMSEMDMQTIARHSKSQPWAERMWHYYHTIGEYRFAVDWKGNMLSKAILGASYDDGTGPKAVTEGQAKFWMDNLHGDRDGQAEMLRQFGIHWTVAGECYLMSYKDTDPMGDGGDIWQVISPTVIRIPQTDDAKYAIDNVEIDLPKSEVYCWRIWNPDPQRPLLAMAPSRSVLSDLAEIERLTEHIAAQIDSRLAGAGILLMPSEINVPTPPVPDGAVVKQVNTAVQLMNLINVAMAQSIRDRSNASAKVPIVITAPGDVIEKIQHLTFWSELDAEAQNMRKEAIRRLALGLDMPPEVLMGTSESNHWNAWQSDESSIKAHTEPLLKVITTSLAKGYLRPNLMGGAEEYNIAPVEQKELRKFSIMADTSEMRLRPNRSKEALELYELGLLTRKAVIRETGFDPDDEMEDEERRLWLLMKVASGQTTPEFVEAALSELGVQLDVAAPASEEDTGHEARPAPSLEQHPVIDIPDRERSERRKEARDVGNVPSADRERRASLSEDRIRLAAAVAVGAEQAVFRALERAGNRMRNKIGGKSTGVSAGETYLTFGCQPGDLDFYLDDAWGEGVYALAHHTGIAPEVLKDALDGYCRVLLTTQQPHSFKLLEKHLEMGLRGVAA